MMRQFGKRQLCATEGRNVCSAELWHSTFQPISLGRPPISCDWPGSAQGKSASLCRVATMQQRRLSALLAFALLAGEAEHGCLIVCVTCGTCAPSVANISVSRHRSSSATCMISASSTVWCWACACCSLGRPRRVVGSSSSSSPVLHAAPVRALAVLSAHRSHTKA